MMDLGCLDMGCIEKRRDEPFLDSETTNPNNDPPLLIPASKLGKNKASTETGQSNASALNKFTSQIKKPTHRKGSPLSWFPRKKVDSYLKRKIKLLQEVGGMNSTLDETLGDSNPHYSRVLREKIAVKEAAHKAMEARKAAMVEASWCRILQAARIHSKEAEAQLSETEKTAAEAFEAATAIGVTLYDIPDCPQKHYEIETSSVNGGGSATHTVAASFETAFEVDKQVAAAVKAAFVKLASCPSINKDEFKELLRTISQNPDTGENNHELSEFSSECESDTGSELESGMHGDGLSSQDLNSETTVAEGKQRKYKKMQVSEKFHKTKLVDMMLERLRCLQEDELASLATIVATCGLNAALAEAENSKQLGLGSVTDCNSAPALNFPRRISSFGAGATRNSNMNGGQMRRNQAEAELPSLDKFLVKHLTKLEREVQDAKNVRMNNAKKDKSDVEKVCSAETVPDFGSLLLKHSSKLEKEIEESKKNSGKSSDEMEGQKSQRHNGEARHIKQDVTDLPSLDKFLVRHVSKLEREVEEAKNRRKTELGEGGGGVTDLRKKTTSVAESHISEEGTTSSCSDRDQVGKENIDLNKKGDGELEMEQRGVTLTLKLEKTKDCSGEPSIQFQQTNLEAAEENSLDKILIKPVHRLEREKMEALSLGSNYGIQQYQKKHGGGNVEDCESLDKVLVKHVSRLEREKMALGSTKEEGVVRKLKRRDPNIESENGEGSLDQILVKHRSRLEKEKMAANQQPEDEQIRHGEGNVEDCESLDKVLVKHVSRLEREKMALGTKEGVVRKLKRRDPNIESENGEGVVRKLNRRDIESENGEGSLDQILVKHRSRLEKEKMAANQQPEDEQIRHGEGNVEDCESLDKVLVKHVSRLEREKMALGKKEGVVRKLKRRDPNIESENGEGSLDQILVKHRSRLEKEKMAVNQQPEDEQIRHSVSRREARERELRDAWGGLSLGNSMRPHLSRLQRDKAAWIKAEEEERTRAVEEV